MHDSHHNRQYDYAVRPVRQIAVAALLLLVALSIGSFFIAISWNHFVPEVFGLAELDIRTAAGVVLFVFTIGSILRLTLTGQRRRHGHRQ